LNTALTVEAGKAGSHLDYWKEFIIKTIKYSSYSQGMIWLMWGKKAQSFIKYIYNPFTVGGYNEKTIKLININKYNVFDIDAFSNPYKIFDYILSKNVQKSIEVILTDGLSRSYRNLKLAKKIIGFSHSLFTQIPRFVSNKIIQYICKKNNHKVIKSASYVRINTGVMRMQYIYLKIEKIK